MIKMTTVRQFNIDVILYIPYYLQLSMILTWTTASFGVRSPRPAPYCVSFPSPLLSLRAVRTHDSLVSHAYVELDEMIYFSGI
jgi:hypothetical protein